MEVRTYEPLRPRHRRQPGDRPGHRPRLSAAGDTVAVTYRSGEPPDGLFGGALRRHRAPTRRRGVRARSRPSRARSRCWWPTPASPATQLLAADERGRLRRRRSTPTSPAPTGSPSAPCGGMMRAAARPDHLHLLGRRAARLGRPGQLRGVQGRAWSASPGRSPASSGSRNITANVVAPGLRRDRHDRRRCPRTRKAEILAQVPLGRYAAADEVAGVVRFLAGDDAAYITGAVIPVDGGLGMGH